MSRSLDDWDRATSITDGDKILRKNVKFPKKMRESTGEDYVWVQTCLDTKKIS